MYEPRPHGLLAVGGELTDEDSAAVELLARRLTNLKQVSGVESLRMVRSLPDGGYAIAQDMGGTFRVITHKPTPTPVPTFEGVAVDYVPMLFSGVITRAILHETEGVGIKLSEQTRRRLVNYATDTVAPKSVDLQRFRIDYGDQFAELKPQVETVVMYTQYAAQRPTWYSGAMAEVMQIVGGYGRQIFDELPDTPVERARMLIPQQVRDLIRKEMGNVRLPGYTGFPHSGGVFQYDYKFNRTDAVGFDTQDKPWLLRVQPDGVWAMPLPLIPATTTTAYRNYIDSKGDAEVTAILDRFGGLPSGETFPSVEADFQAWRRAGVIVKICGTADFYDHIAYSSALGWSLNLRGTEGYNTCYDYYDSEGLGYGLTYKLRLLLLPATDAGKLPPLVPDNPDDQAALNLYLSQLYEYLAGNDAPSLAIKYKLRRVEASTILGRVGGTVNQSEVDYWGNLELAPIAAHGGTLTEVGRGYLYHASPFPNQPQIKYPEPFMGGCVSHDFLPLINGRGKSSYPNSDTIMFMYYLGDQVKAVKYFREGRGFNRETENDFDECMTVGSWTQTETTGSSTLAGYFYTTDLDERIELAPVVTVTNIVGKDKGYDSKPFFAFDDFFSSVGSMWRNRYYTRQTNTHTTEGSGLDVAVCIPYLTRNAILHAKRASTTGERTTASLVLLSMTDPNSYRYYTYDFVFAWVGGSTHGNAGNAAGASPGPKDGNPVWVMGYNYGPGPCTDFADQGDWVGSLPQDYTWLIHPKKNEWNHSGGGGAPAFKGYSTSTTAPATEKRELKCQILNVPELVHDHPDNVYFLGSPDQAVGVFYRDACRVVFGDTTYANVSEVADGGRKHWGGSTLVDHQSAHHFIGVINE